MMPRSHVLALLPIVIATAAPCNAAGGEEQESPYVAEHAPNGIRPKLSLDSISNPEWRRDLQLLMSETLEVVNSETFRRYLENTENMSSRKGAPRDVTGAFALSALSSNLAEKPLPVKYVPMWGKVRLLGFHTGSVASCDFDLFIQRSNQTASTALSADASTTYLNRCTLDRAATRPKDVGDRPEPFACAINTVVHEWTHAIPSREDNTESLFQDGSHTKSERLVSYTVGAIAQCVYLSRFRDKSFTLDKCVERVGTGVFNSDTCGDD